MQPQAKKRAQRMSREQQLKHKENMALPQNRFLNSVKDEESKELKYSMATKLRPYLMLVPDPILDDMRLSNALLHQVRWNKKQATKYLDNYERDDPVTVKDKEGRIMDKDDCYAAYVSSTQNVYLTLSTLRKHLSENLLIKSSTDFFTFEQYNEFVEKTDKIVSELGYELFPTEIKLIEPL